MRAHARRNYDQILRVATTVFAESGPDASLNEIARRAGVGPGTLYRHFPNRQALQAAVLGERIENLCGHGADLLSLPDADTALARWLRSLLIHTRTDKGLGAATLTHATDQGAQCRIAIEETAARLVARAKDSGTVRGDTSADDLVHLVAGIGLATEHRSDPAQAERLLDTVLRGIGIPGTPAP